MTAKSEPKEVSLARHCGQPRHGANRGRFRRLPHRHADQQAVEDQQMDADVAAMTRMLKELEAPPPEAGCLGWTSLGLTSSSSTGAASIIWRPMRAPATAPASLGRVQSADEGRPRRRRHLARDLSRAREYETFYSGMPLMGLAKASRQAAVTADSDSARARLGLGARPRPRAD